jgi:hypothetical protein
MLHEYGYKVYVAGPMTGIPQMNFPCFDDAASALRQRGYEVVSPAELDSPESRAAALASEDGTPAGYAEGETWGQFLARDVKLIADEGIQAIVVLPGWQESRGARLETFVARLCGLPILKYPHLDPVAPIQIEKAHGHEKYQSAPVIETTLSRRELEEMPLADLNRYVGHHIVATTFGGAPIGESVEVETVDETTGGRKGSKPERFDLLPWPQLAEVARLYREGSKKYECHNWMKGYAWHLSFASLIRHATQFWGGEETDAETGCSHLASVVFHALALMYFAEHHREKDDRPEVSV